MRFLSYLASRFRPLVIFRLLRHLHGTSGFSLVEKLFDPNSIRNKVAIDFPENLAVLNRGGYSLEVNLNDHVGYWTYISQTPFEQSVYRLATSMKLGANDAILDIGANIGLASIPYCTEHGCELVAVEASKQNAAHLLRNAAMNNVRMITHVVALTSSEYAGQYLSLFLKSGNLGANSLFASWAPSIGKSKVEKVPSTTLDALINENDLIDRIKIIKIDVEGAELQVLRGGMNFLAKNKAPILMEYRLDAAQKYLGSDLAEVVSIMQEHYEIFGYDDDGQETPFLEGQSYENVLFRRKTV